MAAPAGAECIANHQSTKLPIRFGSVNRQRGLQPPPTLLASVYVSPANSGLPGDDILWTCDEDDRKDLHFLVATNGNHLHGGHLEIGGSAVKNVYATWFKDVGLRQRIGDVTLTRRWQKVPLGPIPAGPEPGKLHIRVKDIPPLYAELYWVEKNIKRAKGVSACPGEGSASASKALYTCDADNGYLQFVGPGLVHDNKDEDSLSSRRGINAGNGFGYRMYNASTLLRATASCVVRSPDLSVIFPPISAGELMKGQTMTANFRIELKCNGGAESGKKNGNPSYFSLQASPGAFAAAQARGLVNGQGRVTYLLSDRTGSDPSLAQGVGIALRCGQPDKGRCYFSSPFNPGSQNSEQEGWYPWRENARRIPPASDDIHWMLEFEAVLTRLPDAEEVKPGKVHATARITVKVP